MILVPAEVRPSGIHGNGLFATAPIAKGTPFWRFVPGFDQALPPEHVQSLPPAAQEYLRHYAYLDGETGCAVLSGDHARFMNHSASPNTGAPAGAVPPITTVALGDIAEGEEITCDYGAFDAATPQKLGAYK